MHQKTLNISNPSGQFYQITSEKEYLLSYQLVQEMAKMAVFGNIWLFSGLKIGKR